MVVTTTVVGTGAALEVVVGCAAEVVDEECAAEVVEVGKALVVVGETTDVVMDAVDVGTVSGGAGAGTGLVVVVGSFTRPPFSPVPAPEPVLPLLPSPPAEPAPVPVPVPVPPVVPVPPLALIPPLPVPLLLDLDVSTLLEC